MMINHLWLWSTWLAYLRPLPILLIFFHFHTFQGGGPSMIWDANSSKMEEPNANEQK
jgi:hypothetical protein